MDGKVRSLAVNEADFNDLSTETITEIEAIPSDSDTLVPDLSEKVEQDFYGADIVELMRWALQFLLLLKKKKKFRFLFTGQDLEGEGFSPEEVGEVLEHLARIEQSSALLQIKASSKVIVDHLIIEDEIEESIEDNEVILYNDRPFTSL
jgi:hypothetical protein